MLKVSHKIFVRATTLFYAAVVSVLSFLHVVWRDEVTPMSVVSQSSSLADLCLRIHSFGHPALWYVLLYLIHQIIHPFWVLKTVNILICVGAIYIFLNNAPFPRLGKILFILGFFPLYLYPVFNRNYGIGMLLLFAFASLYPKRFEKMIPLGLILLLLANAHAHCLITAIAILIALKAEFLFSPKSRQLWQAHLNKTIIGFALIAIGIIFSAIQTIPDHNNIAFSPHVFSAKEVVNAFIKSVFFPGKAFINVLGVPSVLFTTLAVLCVYIYLIAKPYLFIFFSFSVIGLGVFYHLIFQSDEMRHQGALYLLLITVFWIESYAPDVPLGITINKLRNSIVRHKESFLVFLLVLQICMAYPAITNAVTSVYSSSKSLGVMLKQSPQFKDAVLIGEPGAMVEAVPYYTDNPVYLPREGKFKKYTEFTTNQKPQYSLAELLIAAQNIKLQTNKTVLIVMGHKLSLQGPFLVKMTHNRSFIYSKEALNDFYAQTRLIAVFNKATSDENYNVYLLK
ncbi:MAG: hypothetical protein HQL14_02030 [Candidatus Omnitrophica bacterium]|nr:hypothetical protein [Candidatus Omnitrophota bacterium]